MGALSKAAMAAGLVVLAGGIGYYLYERNTEQPPFRVSLDDGPFQLREYPPLLVAETVQPGARSEALNRGFRKLAEYIFANSRGGEKISMTAPVIEMRDRIPMTAPVIQDDAKNGNWRTRFVMPAKYTRETLPEPPQGVLITEIPARKVAVARFNGSSEDSALAVHEAELIRWMARHKLRALGEAEYAFYNSPFIPAFLRRNEILIPVAER